MGVCGKGDIKKWDSSKTPGSFFIFLSFSDGAVGVWLLHLDASFWQIPGLSEESFLDAENPRT